MYKVIFVDDEVRTIESLSTVIPWEELNIRTIGIFDNGISALQMMVDERPDILVTDLVMPVIDGLELIKRAKEMYPSLECLVLSGYEEFELARGAIACGARDYLVKPCKIDELTQSLKKCVKSIEDNRDRMTEDYELRQSRTESLYEQLMTLCTDNPDLQERDIEKLMEYSQDYGMLRDAAIMAVIQNEPSAQRMQELLKGLSQRQSAEAVISDVTATFKSLNLQKQPADAMVQKIIEYVDKNYAMQSLNLQHIADKVVFLTPRYIGKRFMIAMNMRFSDYLLQIRINNAISILEQTEKINAGKVAEQVGLGNNVQYFFRLFKQKTGMTVREFKKQIGKE